MKAIFEVKYLDVAWYDKEIVLNIQESFTSLKVKFDDEENYFFCNTVIYPKAKGIKHGRLAFRFLSKNNAEPYFEKADGGRIALKKIIDTDSGKTWWIEADGWKRELKIWGFRAFRTAGTVNVGMGSQKCQVTIGLSEFTSEQLYSYLSDFKNDLWELILDEESYVTGRAKKLQDGGVSEESIQLINNLLSHAQNILKSPKSELREIQTLKPRKIVKPVNRTFMELATKGDGKYLTSRATEPSYNVPENRYVLFALSRVNKILKQLVTISNSKVNRFESSVSKLNERLYAFSDVKAINKNLVRKDLERIKQTYNLKQLNSNLEHKIKACSNEAHMPVSGEIFYIKIGGLTREKDSVFSAVKNQREDDWFEGKRDDRFVFLKYSEEIYYEIFEQGLEYEICGNLYLTQGTAKTGLRWYKYTLSNLISAKVVGGEGLARRREKFQSELEKALVFKSNGWIKILDRRELREQEKERNSVENQLRFYEDNHANVQRVHALLEPKLTKFKQILTQLKKLGIKPSATFPNSMTFVQNPDYQAVHSGYKKIREFANLSDEDLLLSLEKVDEIGLINMPILYERWCLIQIVKVLMQNYHYRPSRDWKRLLVKIATTEKKDRSKNDSLGFDHAHLKRSIQLRYEPKLPNGRFPDYVMDVSFETKSGAKNTRRFVMDAKYYSDDVLRQEGGISGVISDLYHKKNYSEDGKNSVFILHPAKGAIEEIVSPQAWGELSYLGELSMFEWDKAERTLYHQYGAICVNPASRLSYLDEFQRMIGMFLQYGIENNTIENGSDDVESINFCIACGSHDLKPIDTRTKNIKSRWYECNDCKHFTTYNHCFSCNTRLIKNGDYWSYHSQMPMEPLNIKCPACESLL
jgi:hypothetical protein